MASVTNVPVIISNFSIQESIPTSAHTLNYTSSQRRQGNIPCGNYTKMKREGYQAESCTIQQTFPFISCYFFLPLLKIMGFNNSFYRIQQHSADYCLQHFFLVSSLQLLGRQLSKLIRLFPKWHDAGIALVHALRDILNL